MTAPTDLDLTALRRRAEFAQDRGWTFTSIKPVDLFALLDRIDALQAELDRARADLLKWEVKPSTLKNCYISCREGDETHLFMFKGQNADGTLYGASINLDEYAIIPVEDFNALHGADRSPSPDTPTPPADDIVARLVSEAAKPEPYADAGDPYDGYLADATDTDEAFSAGLERGCWLTAQEAVTALRQRDATIRDLRAELAARPRSYRQVLEADAAARQRGENIDGSPRRGAIPAPPDDIVVRSEVLRICNELGAIELDYVLEGLPENARTREASEAMAVRIKAAVAIMPPALRQRDATIAELRREKAEWKSECLSSAVADEKRIYDLQEKAREERDRAADLQRRLDDALGALRPFSNATYHFDKCRDDRPLWAALDSGWPQRGHISLTVGDCRTARAVVEKESK